MRPTANVTRLQIVPVARSDRRASPPLGDRAPLASDPSTAEDSRRTTGRCRSRAGSFPLTVSWREPKRLNARHDLSPPSGSASAAIIYCDWSTIEKCAHAQGHLQTPEKG